MIREQFRPLPAAPLSVGDALRVADPLSARKVSADSPAIEVMTDLRRVPAATIGPGATLGEANQAMILRGVRLLLVLSDSHVVGMVTATDLLGEKPVTAGQARGVGLSEVTVGDIMTPRERFEVLDLDDVLHAQVGHVVSTLKHSGRQHALVVEREGRQAVIRGIFSASQVARQLGIALQTTEVARTFAEIEAAIVR